MSKEGNQRLSLVRLAIGIVVLCALVALLHPIRGGEPIPWIVGSVGLAVVVNIAARPTLAARSSVLMGVASFGLYFVALRSVPHLVGDLGTAPAIAATGFMSGTLFAMVAHGLVFRRPDLAMSLFVGALTVPFGLVFTFERRLFALGYGDTFLLFHIAWYLLFVLGFGAAAALRGRTVGSRP